MGNKMYPITSVCKEDISNCFIGEKNYDEVKKRLKNMKVNEMKYLASKLADDYCGQLYWISLKSIFKDKFL